MKKKSILTTEAVWYKLAKGTWGCPMCKKFCLIQRVEKPEKCLLKGR